MTLPTLRKTMTLPTVIELEDDVMTKEFDSIQHAGNEQLNALTTNFPPLGRSFRPLSPKGLTIRKSQWISARRSSKNC